MSPEAVIAEVRTDAAAEVAAEVSADVRTETAIVTSEVAAVSGQLADHAEVSEERHEEILEGQAWLENQFQLQTSAIQGLSVTLLALQTSVSTQMQAVLSLLETMDRKLSTGSNPSTPPTVEPIAEVVTVEPESAVVDHAEVTTRPENARRRRLI